MPYLLNGTYLLALLLISPWLLYKAVRAGKYRRGLWRKLTGITLLRASSAPRAWFHGVSVGEIHLLRRVVDGFQKRHPDWECVISTTTDTGFDEASRCFPNLKVFFWPLDFSWSVRRALRGVNPSLIVLAEGELWPNFLAACHDRGTPVAVVNGRLSPRSFKTYLRLMWLARPMLANVDLFLVQTVEYAERFRDLGVPPSRIMVTDSVKYDGVATDRLNPNTQEFRRLFAIESQEVVWIAGSTQEPEEKIVLNIFRTARVMHPRLRLVLVPRQKDRFAEVAALVRRSGLTLIRRGDLTKPVTDDSAVILLDTIGELSAVWGLADIAFVGGSLDGRRGGQNMIEPAAYGAAVAFGPHIWNFQETAKGLLAAGAALQVSDATDLETEVFRLLANPSDRQLLGKTAREFVEAKQGASKRTLDAMDELLPSALKSSVAA